MAPTPSDALIRALQNPACYGHGSCHDSCHNNRDGNRDDSRHDHKHPVESVEVIETHISWVLLAGEFAYKIKKPVDFGFLDFSTLEKRRFFCTEELRLNRRTAPDLYLDTVAISGTAAQPIIGGDGPALEYAVRMKRFDPASTFDHLLASHTLPDGAIRDLGRNLAALHRRADIAQPNQAFGHFDSVATPMRENFETLRSLLDDPAQCQQLSALEDWTDQQLSRHRAGIEARQQQGFVRECHGDAHLGNVALIDDRAVLFDCIEFSEDLRWTDVMADLAFTVMDLRDHGAESLAWLLLDEYLAETGDYDGLQLLPLYIVYRAMVRAKIHGLRLTQPDVDRNAVLTEIRGYLDLATEVAHEWRPMLVLTMGLSGSGKSWLAERLVERAGLVRLRSDIERKRLFGLDRNQSSQSGLSGGLYTTESTQKTYEVLAASAKAALQGGFAVLIDATFLKQSHRDRFRTLADELGVPLKILHTVAEDEVLRERIEQRRQAGHDPSEADHDVLGLQQQSIEPIARDEDIATLTVRTAQAGAVEQAATWLSA